MNNETKALAVGVLLGALVMWMARPSLPARTLFQYDPRRLLVSVDRGGGVEWFDDYLREWKPFASGTPKSAPKPAGAPQVEEK